MKRVLLLSVLCLGILLSCTDRDDNVDMVNIRIKNNTEQFFTEVRIAQHDTVYENITAGDYSKYLEYETAFSASSLTILTDSMSLNYFPGEVSSDTLPIGFYTYELSLDADNKIELKFSIDE